MFSNISSATYSNFQWHLVQSKKFGEDVYISLNLNRNTKLLNYLKIKININGFLKILQISQENTWVGFSF